MARKKQPSDSQATIFAIYVTENDFEFSRTEVNQKSPVFQGPRGDRKHIFERALSCPEDRLYECLELEKNA